MTITDYRYSDLKQNYPTYIPNLKKISEHFGGPSIYFHQRALLEGQMHFLSELHLEYIYATLCSWGMHRMGVTSTKMVCFDSFKDSILSIKPELEELKNIRIEDILEDQAKIFPKLEELCFSVKISSSNSKIVGNSKALAHILPNLVPPIDRQYTIKFFSKTLSDFSGEDNERKFFNHIIKRYSEFIKIIKADNLIKIDNSFNTSYPKIMDNLVMTYLKFGSTA